MQEKDIERRKTKDERLGLGPRPRSAAMVAASMLQSPNIQHGGDVEEMLAPTNQVTI